MLFRSLTIQRTWRDTYEKGGTIGYYDEGYTDLPKGTLSDRKLSIQVNTSLLLPIDDQDPETGDRPIMRLFTQLIVEVLELEPEKEAEIETTYRDAEVYIAGGFAVSPRWTEPTTDEIKASIQKARQKNKLFPRKYRRDSPFTVVLKKSFSNGATQFVTKDKDGQENPALVDFTLDEPPIDWKEKITAHRVLSVSKGRILPNFYARNLYRFEGASPF